MADQKKSKKFGRNAKSCLAYKLSARREQNKSRRLLKHLTRFPSDGCATSAMNRCKAALSVGQLRELAKLETAATKRAA